MERNYKSNLLFFILSLSLIFIFSCDVNSGGGTTANTPAASSTNTENSSAVSSNSSNSYYFYDDFTSATTDTILTSSYTGYSTTVTSPVSPMYIINNGSVTVTNGALTLAGGARLSIGANGTAQTTSSTTPGGCFDLTGSYTITIVVSAVSVSDTKTFQVMVDNNTTSGSSSPLDSDSRIYSKTPAVGTITITGVSATTTSFICLRTESTVSVTIDSITVTKGTSSSSSSGTSTSGSTTSSSSTGTSTSGSTSSAVSSVVTSLSISSIPSVPAITTQSTDLYVSTTGTDSAAGTSSDPTTLPAAILKIPAGSTIWMMDGTYSYSSQITIDLANDGTSGNLKNIAAINPGSVTLDFSGESYDSSDLSLNARGIQLNANYWHIKGLKVYGAADNGIFLAGNYNIIENCILQANRDSGLQISRRLSSLSSIADWPSYNLIIYCESYDNCDPATNENADGFASKLTCGYGNVFEQCISHNNIDDGWDLYTKTATGAIGPVTIDRCIAYSNGTLTNGTSSTSGDRNGFKLGGSDMANVHYVTRCISFNNGKNGFTWNSNPGAIELSNCLAWDNVAGNYKFDNTSVAVFYNCISYWTSGAGISDRHCGNAGSATGATNCFWNKSKSPYTYNDNGLLVTSADFVTNPASITSVTRNADGSIDFSIFKLATGSDLLNAGVIPPLKLPYDPAVYFSGTPDIGVVETN